MDVEVADAASCPDEENPEWTQEDVANARPALDVIAGLFGAAAAEGLRRKRGKTNQPEYKSASEM